MKQIWFFAIHEDLVTFLELVDREASLRYTRTGNFLRSEVNDSPLAFARGTEIPDLGIASAATSAISASYLVSCDDTPINLRIVGISQERVCVDQLINPDTVLFTPGGIWMDRTVILGRVSTVSQSQQSQLIMKRFVSAIAKTSVKVQQFYVGKNAMRLFESGTRFTDAEQSPWSLG